MTVRVAIRGPLLRWAEVRSRVSAEDLRSSFPDLDAWKEGAKVPTLKQIEKFGPAGTDVDGITGSPPVRGEGHA